MKTKPIYKILDDKGRILIPKEMRDGAEMEPGGIVRLVIDKGIITARKVDLIEMGDQSPEVVEAYVRAAIREIPEDTLFNTIEKRKG